MTCPELAVCSGVQPAIQIKAWGGSGSGFRFPEPGWASIWSLVLWLLGGKKNDRVPGEASYGKWEESFRPKCVRAKGRNQSVLFVKEEPGALETRVWSAPFFPGPTSSWKRKQLDGLNPLFSLDVSRGTLGCGGKVSGIAKLSFGLTF